MEQVQQEQSTQIAVASAGFKKATAADRVRRHRERRRDGLRCITIELRDTEVEALVKHSLLKPDQRENRSAILSALYAFLDEKLN